MAGHRLGPGKSVASLPLWLRDFAKNADMYITAAAVVVVVHHRCSPASFTPANSWCIGEFWLPCEFCLLCPSPLLERALAKLLVCDAVFCGCDCNCELVFVQRVFIWIAVFGVLGR